jgi:HSP20 family molecular chaperone IbpA
MSTENMRIWVDPCPVCDVGCSDEGDDSETLTYEIPGVKKEEIKLHVVKDGLRLVAPRHDKYEFFSEHSFACDAMPDKVKAKYEDGLLTVNVPLDCPKPFKDSKQITIE